MTTRLNRSRALTILQRAAPVLSAASLLVLAFGCTPSSGTPSLPPSRDTLPVIAVEATSATIYRDFSATLEGSQNIEIRAQVDGYLDRIYVDEGAHVGKGQPLFRINQQPYREQLNNAVASLSAARANLANAEINVTRLTPLVENGVVADVQLASARAARDAAAAAVAQAEALVESARINLGYTTISAPVAGYIGRIPHKAGSLVGPAAAEALTVLSQIDEMYAYFGFSERDFLAFTRQFPGRTVEDKITRMPPVELILADGSAYPHRGRVETVSGQFDPRTGAISFRATFRNPDGLLRSGYTGMIRVPQTIDSSIVIPQAATFEIQDKVLVFRLGEKNEVTGAPVQVAGRIGNFYLVERGLRPGEKIVFAGLDRLTDGAVIHPQLVSLDSLFKEK